MYDKNSDGGDPFETNDNLIAYFKAGQRYDRAAVIYNVIVTLRTWWILFFLAEYINYDAVNQDPVTNETMPTLVMLYGNATLKDTVVTDKHREIILENVKYQNLLPTFDEYSLYVCILSAFIVNDLKEYYRNL